MESSLKRLTTFLTAIFFLQHSVLHVKFFQDCMTDETLRTFVQKCLLNLAEGYHKSYKLRVSLTNGGLEKRMKNAKLVIVAFEADEYQIRDVAEKIFNRFLPMRSLFTMRQMRWKE